MTHTDRIADLVTHLVDGWTERIEWWQHTTVHTPACQGTRHLLKHGTRSADGKKWLTPPQPGRLKHHRCGCPRRLESRARTVRQAALLTQLAAAHTPTDDGDQAGIRTAPGSRPPGSLDPIDLIHRITTAATDAGTTLGADPAAQARRAPLRDHLRSLVTLAAALEPADPDTVDGVARVLARLVRTARITLGYTQPMTRLRDVCCGECGGHLIAAADASTDVVCVGSDDEDGCGTRYRRYEWAALLEAADPDQPPGEPA